MRLYAIALCALLCGCTAAAPVQAPLPTPAATCIPIRDWSKTDEAKLGGELKSLPADSELWSVTKDWMAMRAAARACAK